LIKRDYFLSEKKVNYKKMVDRWNANNKVLNLHAPILLAFADDLCVEFRNREEFIEWDIHR
jgi:hypothetical protein